MFKKIYLVNTILSKREVFIPNLFVLFGVLLRSIYIENIK